MKLVLLLLAVSSQSSTQALHIQIEQLFKLSVSQCGAFNAGDSECVKRQFFANYRWAVIRDQDSIVGAPGTPGRAGAAGIVGPR